MFMRLCVFHLLLCCRAMVPPFLVVCANQVKFGTQRLMVNISNHLCQLFGAPLWGFRKEKQQPVGSLEAGRRGRRNERVGVGKGRG